MGSNPAFSVAPHGVRGRGAPEPGGPLPRSDVGSLHLVNLLNSFGRLRTLARGRCRAGAWLDAFLLLAGMNQIVEDYLARDALGSRKLVRGLRRRSPGAAGTAAAVASAAIRARSLLPAQRHTMRWQSEAAIALTGLAQHLMAEPPERLGPPGRRSCEHVISAASRLPAGVQRTVLRVPACFQAFDQRPADLAALAARFHRQFSDTTQPILVVGARTSGSYLAPLMSAALARRGFQKVSWITCRTRHGLTATQARDLREAVAAAGIVAIIDDPPGSGSTYRSIAQLVESVGVVRDRIVLLLALFDQAGMPPALSAYRTVDLPWSEWSIHRALTPDQVRTSLSRLLQGRTCTLIGGRGECSQVTVRGVSSVEMLPLDPPAGYKGIPPTRRHVRSLCRVQVATASGGVAEGQVYVRGVGLGYFAASSAAVSRRLGSFVPPVYGVDEGCLFRGWIPGEPRWAAPTGHDLGGLAERTASYAAWRRDHLGLGADPTRALGDEAGPSWYWCTDWLRRALGRERHLARPALRRFARALMTAASPAVTDGVMAADRWYALGTSVVKTEYDTRGREVFSCDPAFDVAGAASDVELALGGRMDAASAFRDAYTRVSAEVVDDERWTAMTIVHLLSYLRALRQGLLSGPDGGDSDALNREVSATKRALSRVHASYLAAKLLDDVTPPVDGPVCALDVDGVLESDRVGYSAVTPASVLALRALALHGYRVVLATGRSLPEVRERCRILRLAGGVAEYGCAVYDAGAGSETTCVPEASLAALTELRGWLPSRRVSVDEDYRLAVRAFVVNADAYRVAPGADVRHAVGDRWPGACVPVVGDGQVDFVPPAVDKASGLRVLLRGFEAAGSGALAMAMGDTWTDLAMLRSARHAFAPANATRDVRDSGVRILSRSYQAGLSQAVAILLGHPPGGCSRCRTPDLTGAGRVMVGILGAEDLTPWRRLLRVGGITAGVLTSTTS
jgi:hydroxymethylpyrimidine pyrophosphatase-like HAD family hydrolase